MPICKIINLETLRLEEHRLFYSFACFVAQVKSRLIFCFIYETRVFVALWATALDVLRGALQLINWSALQLKKHYVTQTESRFSLLDLFIFSGICLDLFLIFWIILHICQTQVQMLWKPRHVFALSNKQENLSRKIRPIFPSQRVNKLFLRDVIL